MHLTYSHFLTKDQGTVGVSLIEIWTVEKTPQKLPCLSGDTIGDRNKS